jgi:hypothetical protein
MMELNVKDAAIETEDKENRFIFNLYIPTRNYTITLSTLEESEYIEWKNHFQSSQKAMRKRIEDLR